MPPPLDPKEKEFWGQYIFYRLLPPSKHFLCVGGQYIFYRPHPYQIIFCMGGVNIYFIDPHPIKTFLCVCRGGGQYIFY